MLDSLKFEQILSLGLKNIQYLTKTVNTAHNTKKTFQSFSGISKGSMIIRKFLRLVESVLIIYKLLIKKKQIFSRISLSLRLLFNFCDHIILIKSSKMFPSIIFTCASHFRNVIWLIECFAAIIIYSYKASNLKGKIQELVKNI